MGFNSSAQMLAFGILSENDYSSHATGCGFVTNREIIQNIGTSSASPAITTPATTITPVVATPAPAVTPSSSNPAVAALPAAVSTLPVVAAPAPAATPSSSVPAMVDWILDQYVLR
ncbi:hypothetical protein BGX23_005960, partial [Mortierella sp. AD031]